MHHEVQKRFGVFILWTSEPTVTTVTQSNVQYEFLYCFEEHNNITQPQGGGGGGGGGNMGGGGYNNGINKMSYESSNVVVVQVHCFETERKEIWQYYK